MYEFTILASYSRLSPGSSGDKEIKNGNPFTVIAIVIVTLLRLAL